MNRSPVTDVFDRALLRVGGAVPARRGKGIVMIMADVLMWFLAVVAAHLVLVCEWLVAAALFPSGVEECRRQYARPWRATLIGLLAMTPLLLLGAAAANAAVHPLPKVLGTGFLLLLLLPALFGAAGLAARVGAGLVPPEEDRLAPRVLRGGLVLLPTLLVPLLGWFILLPWALVSGFGAALITWWSRRSLARAGQGS